MPACLITLAGAVVLYSLVASPAGGDSYGPHRSYRLDLGRVRDGVSSMLASARKVQHAGPRVQEYKGGDEGFHAEVAKIPDGCLVVFVAEWCPHCQAVKSSAEEIAAATKVKMMLLCDAASFSDAFMAELGVKHFPFPFYKANGKLEPAPQSSLTKPDTPEAESKKHNSSRLASLLPSRPSRPAPDPSSARPLDDLPAGEADPFAGIF